MPLGAGDEPLQLVEAALHLLQPQPGLVLLPPDPLQQPLAVLLRHAGALLPLLDPLREDLVDPTGIRGGEGGEKRVGGSGGAARGSRPPYGTLWDSGGLGSLGSDGDPLWDLYGRSAWDV